MRSACIVNYNWDPEDWWLDYGYEPEGVTVYDRSDDGVERTFAAKTVIKTRNIGNVDKDKLDYIIDNYEKLPDVFLWVKSNLFKYITQEEFKAVADNTRFTPLLTKHHKTYSDILGPVCFYKYEMYHERNNSWFLNSHPAKYFQTWNDWAKEFFLPTPDYIPFPPGGNFILTKDVVRKYSKDVYIKMRDLMDYAMLPGEAQCAERSYYLLWS